MPRAKRHLSVVDHSTGELHPAEECPGCQERDTILSELTRKYNGALSQIGRLRADRDMEAREHQAWPCLLELHRYWATLSKHRSTFDQKDFWQALPLLKQWGAGNLAAAIAGICFEPNVKVLRSGRRERYDGWHTVMKNNDTIRRYIARRPQGWQLPESLESWAEKWPRKR